MYACIYGVGLLIAVDVLTVKMIRRIVDRDMPIEMGIFTKKRMGKIVCFIGCIQLWQDEPV